MKLYSYFLWTVVTAGVAFISFEAGLLLRETRLRLDEVAGQVGGLVRPTEQAEANISAAAKTFAQVGAEERNAFADQQRYYTGLASDTHDVLEAFRDTFNRFNDVVIPKVSRDLDSGNDTLRSAGASIQQVAEASDKTISATTPLVESLTVNSRNFEEITAETAKTSANIAGATDDLHRITTEWAKPEKGLWHGVKAIVNFVWSVRGAVGF